MNTGFLGPAVATVLTVYGIETLYNKHFSWQRKLQQCLPFTVLKPNGTNIDGLTELWKLQQCLPFTVLKPITNFNDAVYTTPGVATVLTVYGIETCFVNILHHYQLRKRCNSAYRLRYWNIFRPPFFVSKNSLQQCLPFTVLKLAEIIRKPFLVSTSCNSTYRLRYWNPKSKPIT